MYVAEGVGLAATQIGVGLAVFVYDCPDDDDVRHKGHLVNPRIIATGGPAQKKDEGCLSVPGPYATVDRPFLATVAGQDQHGEPIEVTGTGFLARCLHPRDRAPGRHALHRSPEPPPAQPGAASDRAVPVERPAALAQRPLTLHRRRPVLASRGPAGCLQKSRGCKNCCLVPGFVNQPTRRPTMTDDASATTATGPLRAGGCRRPAATALDRSQALPVAAGHHRAAAAARPAGAW